MGLLEMQPLANTTTLVLVTHRNQEAGLRRRKKITFSWQQARDRDSDGGKILPPTAERREEKREVLYLKQ